MPKYDIVNKINQYSIVSVTNKKGGGLSPFYGGLLFLLFLL
jgi:hypothetical protein